MRKRQYSDDDKATALAALDANEGNVKRTATQLEMPHKTLDDWAQGRKQNPAVAELRNRKKGTLAEKFDNLAHSLVDAMPAKIAKATLSQCAVTAGIAVDKGMRLRQEEGPTSDLCRLIGISPGELPPTLQLEPGQEIPEGFGPILDTKSNADGSYEVEKPDQSADASPTGDTQPPATGNADLEAVT